MTRSLKTIGAVSPFFKISLLKHRSFLALALSFLLTIKHLMRVVCSPLPHLSFAFQLTMFCLWPYPALKLPSLRSNIFLADKSHISHLLLNLGSQHPVTQLATPSGKLSLALASWGLLPLCQLILKIHFLCSPTSLPKQGTSLFSLNTLFLSGFIFFSCGTPEKPSSNSSFYPVQIIGHRLWCESFQTGNFAHLKI